MAMGGDSGRTGGHVPPIIGVGGTSMGLSPPKFVLFVSILSSEEYRSTSI